MSKACTAGRGGRQWWEKMTATALGCLLLGMTAGPAWAQPKPEDVLRFQPRQQGVVCTTPAADKVANCKVELVKGQTGSGWVLKDEDGNILRRFYNTRFTRRDDGTKIDTWSYYKDGVEVYREWATTNGEPPDQYRWLNSGGAKWGVDENKDGRIESWKVISPEEVSQEALQAFITRDVARFQALLISEAEIKAIDMPAEMAKQVREQVKAAPEKFNEVVGKLTKLSPKATWIHLETVAPQCLPADQTGSRFDLVKHARGTILYDTGSGSEWLQTGEMIKVGTAWRLVSVPVPGAAPPETPGSKGGTVSDVGGDPELQKLIEELTQIDKRVPPSGGGGVNEALARHHLQRTDLLEKIVGKVKPTERDPWVRQVADSLSTAAQASPASDTTAMTRLLNLEKQLAAGLPAGHTLTAYVTFREMQADYSRRIGNGSPSPDFNKVQQAWLERLGKFVQDFPRGEDTPDALLQAGMVSEFLNKEVEAKNWYAQIVRNSPDKPQAPKAAGAVRRLEMEGKPFKLAGPTLADTNVAFDVDQLSGKVVIVYYWASWNGQCAGDFAKLKQLLDSHAGKGLALVCVNLDNTVEDARKYLASSPVPGTHLYQTGGLEGKLATDYGVMVLPSTFLVGKDGKVVSRNAQVANLEDEIKKLLK